MTGEADPSETLIVLHGGYLIRHSMVANGKQGLTKGASSTRSACALAT